MSAIQIQASGSGAGTLSIAAPITATNRTLTLPDATTTLVGTDATQTLTNKTLTTPNIDSAQVATVLGTTPLYMARAWVNFNGTGTVAILASGNVTSITDNGVGDYTVNFTTALSDANYTITTCAQLSTASSATRVLGLYATATDGSTGVTKTTSAVRLACQVSTTAAAIDMVFNGVAIFR